jgi:hypothetical protein
MQGNIRRGGRFRRSITPAVIITTKPRKKEKSMFVD